MLIQETKAIFAHRELLGQMVGREIKARYKQSILGYFWVILNPFFQMLVMSFVFSTIMRIPTYASSNIPYMIFLYTALLPWTLFSNAVNGAANSLVGNSALLTKVYFPRIIFPLANLVAKIVDYFFASIVLVVFMLIFHIPVTLNLLWFIPIFLIQQIFTLGLSLFVAATNLFYRDIQYLLGLIMMLWMYLTPVIYPVELIPERYRVVFQLNPMSVLVNAYRQTILAGGMPNLLSLSLAFLVSLVTLYISYLFFKRLERTFADVV